MGKLKSDTIVIHSRDRLARNLDDLRQIVNGQTTEASTRSLSKKVLFLRVIDNPMDDLMLSVLGAVAQFERDKIKERQMGFNEQEREEDGRDLRRGHVVCYIS